MSSIHARDLIVDFPIFTNSHRSLKNTVLRATTGGRLARADNRFTVRALDGVSFDFRVGDRVGLMGHNGSGKTTLLRVLVGAYEPIAGELSVDGRVASLLDVSMGIDPDASGYENILLRGIMMGLRPKEIRRQMEEIAEFTELGNFLDMPVRTYSTGMQMRLSFAVATSVSADIVIMDEWLSVGDAEFQEKASARLEELLKRAAILVIASHSPELVARVCNRALRLEHGRIVEEFVPVAPANDGMTDPAAPAMETSPNNRAVQYAA